MVADRTDLRSTPAASGIPRQKFHWAPKCCCFFCRATSGLSLCWDDPASRHRTPRNVKFSADLPDAFDDDTPDPIEQEELDRDFPLGDGTADTEALVHCPYCGEAVEIALDPGSGATQEYVEDCEICCQPWRVSVSYGADGEASVILAALDQ